MDDDAEAAQTEVPTATRRRVRAKMPNPYRVDADPQIAPTTREAVMGDLLEVPSLPMLGKAKHNASVSAPASLTRPAAHGAPYSRKLRAIAENTEILLREREHREKELEHEIYLNAVREIRS